jgi:hypothetical protein
VSLSIRTVRFSKNKLFGQLENQPPNLGRWLFWNTQVIWNGGNIWHPKFLEIKIWSCIVWTTYRKHNHFFKIPPPFWTTSFTSFLTTLSTSNSNSMQVGYNLMFEIGYYFNFHVCFEELLDTTTWLTLYAKK